MTRVQLDIDFATEPISGTLERENGAQHEFVGWLGLSELLGRIGRGEEVAGPRTQTKSNQEGASHGTT